MAYALLIDDDQSILDSASTAAVGAGLTLETAATWEDGIAKFHAHSPELVISDYNLPGSEMGLTLLLEVARLKPSTRLILLSAFLDDADAEEIRALGLVDDVVSKIDPQMASKILDEVASAQERAQQPTDWAGFGAAAGRARAVDQDALEKLDRFLRTSRLPGAKP